MFTSIIQTSDIKNYLYDIAQQRGVTQEKIGIDIISYETRYKGIVDDDWQYVFEDNILECITESEVRSDIFILEQNYTVRFRDYKAHPYLDLRCTITTDKYKSKLFLTIDPSSRIPMKKGVQSWIKEVIWEKKLRNGFLIGLYDQALDREIHKLLLKIQKEGELKQPYRITIGEFFPPIFATDDKIVFHYKTKQNSSTLVTGVHPDELILEYIFPQYGRNGRGCDGKLIEVPDPKINHAHDIVINDDTIYTEVDSQSIRFYARVSGYVLKNRGTYTISQELQIEAANFKQTGSIETGIDKDISLKIKKKSPSEDAIGMGVNIDVQKLDVNGTVGSHTKIQACDITIGAQTHRKSQINVTETATIHLHRGNLKAKEAHIDILESGKVEADHVYVQKMVGGEIIARTIHIETLYSNARVIAMESITIGTIEGEGNKLIIDPSRIEFYHNQITELEHEIKNRTSRLQIKTKEFIRLQISFKEKSSRISDTQSRMIKAKEHGLQLIRGDMIRLQQYKTEAEKLKTVHSYLKEAELVLNERKATLENLYSAHLHAEINHAGIYNGKNRITFIDPKTCQEYWVTPEGNGRKITLRIEEDEKKIYIE